MYKLILILLLLIPTAEAYTFLKRDDLIINIYCDANRSDYDGYYMPTTKTKGKINIYICQPRARFVDVLIHELSHHYCWLNEGTIEHDDCFLRMYYKYGGRTLFEVNRNEANNTR